MLDPPGAFQSRTDITRMYIAAPVLMAAVGITVTSPTPLGWWAPWTRATARPDESAGTASSTCIPESGLPPAVASMTFERQPFPVGVQSPKVSPNRAIVRSRWVNVIPRSVPWMSYMSSVRAGLVGPVTSWRTEVAPLSTGMVPSSPVIHGGKRRTEDAVASSTELVAFASDPVTGKGPRELGGMFPKKLLHGPLSPEREPADPEELEEPVEPADWAEEIAPEPPMSSASARSTAAMTG